MHCRARRTAKPSPAGLAPTADADIGVADIDDVLTGPVASVVAPNITSDRDAVSTTSQVDLNCGTDQLSSVTRW